MLEFTKCFFVGFFVLSLFVIIIFSLCTFHLYLISRIISCLVFGGIGVFLCVFLGALCLGKDGGDLGGA